MKKFKLLIFILIPIVTLFLVLETCQRIRYSVKQRNPGWMFYGVSIHKKNAPPKIIKTQDQKAFTAMVLANLENAVEMIREEKSKYGTSYKCIFCIGGSSTQGAFNNEFNKYPYLLNVALNQSLPTEKKERFIVFNFGGSGKVSDEYKIILLTALPKIKPDAVIFYTGYNDIFVKSINKAYASFCAKFLSFYRYIEKYSLFALTVKEKIIFQKFNRPITSPALRAHYKKLEDEFENNISECVKILRDKDIKVLLIPEVLMAREFGSPLNNYLDYKQLYLNIPKILKRIAKRYDCEFLSAQEYFDLRDFSKLFVDPVHLTDKGNEELSLFILKNSELIKNIIRGRGRDQSD